MPPSSEPPQHPAAQKPQPGLTGRSLLIAIVLTILSGVWVRQSEIIVLSTQISESIPAIPGLAALVFLLPINALLRCLQRQRSFRRIRALSRAELLTIFLFVTVSSTMMGVGVLRFLFSLLCSPFYFSQEKIDPIQKSFPGWIVPHNTETIRQLYESSPNGLVPWSVWWQPGLVWLGFFLALWWTMYCMVALFYRTWVEEEKLSFPLVFLPMEMTGGETDAQPFFRNRRMWYGFAVAAVYNLVNIFHALNPSAPAFGKEIDFSPLLTAPPWNAISSLSFHIRPEMIGLGFLISTEISLTVWFSFLVMKLVTLWMVSSGYPPGQMPYPQEQGIGAYLVLAGMLVWLSRRNLRALWRSAVRGDAATGPEGVRSRNLFLGFFGGFLLVWAFATKVGMAGWVAFVYIAIVLAVALVYGRLRAETGVPLVWLFPYSMQKSLLLYTFGSQPFVASGQTTMPVWGLFTFLARGYFPAMTGYQLEGMELARRANIPPRRIVLALCLAVAVGFGVGWYNHLTPYYHYGAQQLRGGIWGTWVSIPEYRTALDVADTPRLPELPRVWATCFGGLTVAGLWLMRLRFTGFLLHPLGYAMTCSYGDLIWASFLIVWLVKSLTLRYGGMRLYRTMVPFFLGLALGHFAVAGILWGLLGAFTGDAVRGYEVFFG